MLHVNMLAVFRSCRLFFNHINLLNYQIHDRFLYRTVKNINKSSFHCSNCLLKTNFEASNEKSSSASAMKKPEKKVKERLTYITLVEGNDYLTVTTLEDATKLAQRRNLKLVKIKDYDTKTERCTYQLMSPGEYLKEEKKSKNLVAKTKSNLKGSKLVSMSSKIEDNDLNSKIKNMIKWLGKQYEVRIVISDERGEAVSQCIHVFFNFLATLARL